MKYGIFRHENAIGNSAEQINCLSRYIKKINDKDPKIFVETPVQLLMARCIPNIKITDINFFPRNILVDLDYDTPRWKGYHNPKLYEYYMPGVYPFPKIYPASWGDISTLPDVELTFPNNYENKLNLPKDSIVIFVRETGTYWKRVDGEMAEPERFADPKTFHQIALHYANKGFTVVQIGDKNQTPFPEHKNIINLTSIKENRQGILDDLYLIFHSKLFISCDSGIWPMAGGMKKNLILCNVKGDFYTQWLPKETTRIIKKINEKDNSFEEIIVKAEELL